MDVPFREPPLADQVRHWSNSELSRVISRCEDAIAEGSARVPDFEAYVLCEHELARRTWT